MTLPETTTKTLAELAEGDPVVIRRTRYGEKTAEAARVTRTTRTQIVVGLRRYRRQDGREIGGDEWHPYFIVPLTAARVPELEEAALETERRRLAAYLHHSISWHNYSLDRLRRIKAILDEPATETEQSA